MLGWTLFRGLTLQENIKTSWPQTCWASWRLWDTHRYVLSFCVVFTQYFTSLLKVLSTGNVSLSGLLSILPNFGQQQEPIANSYFPNKLEMIPFCDIHKNIKSPSTKFKSDECYKVMRPIITNRGVCNAFNSVNMEEYLEKSAYTSAFDSIFKPSSTRELIKAGLSGSEQTWLWY